MFFHWSVESHNCKQNNLWNTLRKSSPSIDTLVEKLLNCSDYFSRLSAFPDLHEKVFLIIFKFFELDCSTIFCNSNLNKTVQFFLVSRDREIITVKSLKSKKKKLALTLFYYVSREIWLGNSKNLICIDQSRFYIFSHPREFKHV